MTHFEYQDGGQSGVQDLTAVAEENHDSKSFMIYFSIQVSIEEDLTYITKIYEPLIIVHVINLEYLYGGDDLKFNFRRVIQYYIDQWSKPRQYLSIESILPSMLQGNRAK